MPDILKQPDAFNIAQAHVAEIAEKSKLDLVILEEETVETTRGWVFFYNSAEFATSHNPLDALAGNGPILVSKLGTLTQLPTSIPWQDALAKLPL